MIPEKIENDNSYIINWIILISIIILMLIFIFWDQINHILFTYFNINLVF